MLSSLPPYTTRIARMHEKNHPNSGCFFGRGGGVPERLANWVTRISGHHCAKVEIYYRFQCSSSLISQTFRDDLFVLLFKTNTESGWHSTLHWHCPYLLSGFRLGTYLWLFPERQSHSCLVHVFCFAAEPFILQPELDTFQLLPNYKLCSLECQRYVTVSGWKCFFAIASHDVVVYCMTVTVEINNNNPVSLCMNCILNRHSIHLLCTFSSLQLFPYGITLIYRGSFYKSILLPQQEKKWLMTSLIMINLTSVFGKAK